MIIIILQICICKIINKYESICKIRNEKKCSVMIGVMKNYVKIMKSTINYHYLKPQYYNKTGWIEYNP